MYKVEYFEDDVQQWSTYKSDLNLSEARQSMLYHVVTWPREVVRIIKLVPEEMMKYSPPTGDEDE